MPRCPPDGFASGAASSPPRAPQRADAGRLEAVRLHGCTPAGLLPSMARRANCGRGSAGRLEAEFIELLKVEAVAPSPRGPAYAAATRTFWGLCITAACGDAPGNKNETRSNQPMTNRSASRAGSKALQAKQVQGWFLNKFPASDTKPTCAPTPQVKASASEVNVSVSGKKSVPSEDKHCALDTSTSNNEDAVSPDVPSETRDKIPELEELEFEAKSAKDSAWYDIAIFLAHRRNRAGEIEGNEEALHFDAHVLEVERKQHDIRGCRCVFLVEYDHDRSQERVSLRRLSRRPKYF